MSEHITRRCILSAGLAASVGAAAPLGEGSTVRAAQAASNADTSATDNERFLTCFNTSTIRAHKLPVTKVVDLVDRAGFQAVELWVDEIERHVKAGGSTKDLRKQLGDAGLAVPGAISFFHWMVDDDAKRRDALEKAKRWMGLLAEVGARHIAAPPCGKVEDVDLLRAAERYRDLLELGDEMGVVPAVEVWGFAKNVHRLGQAVLIALEAKHPKACILPDVYHLYKGGSDLSAVRRVHADLLAGFHMNDYPADPPRDKIADRHRVYPGDGIAPLGQLIRDLRAIGYRGPLSVELFNPEYARQDPAVVVKTSLEKLRAVVASA